MLIPAHSYLHPSLLTMNFLRTSTRVHTLRREISIQSSVMRRRSSTKISPTDTSFKPPTKSQMLCPLPHSKPNSLSYHSWSYIHYHPTETMPNIMDCGETNDDPPTTQPPMTSTAYERHNVNSRNSSTWGTPNRNAEKRSKVIDVQEQPGVKDNSHNFAPMDFGHSGRCANTPTNSDSDVSAERRKTEHPSCVLRATLYILTSIGAGLTLESNDTLRVFSYNVDHTVVFVNDPVLWPLCVAYGEPCDNCQYTFTLMNDIEDITRKLYNVVARPSFQVDGAQTDDESTELRDEVRYKQAITRPTSPPTKNSWFFLPAYLLHRSFIREVLC